MKKVTDYEISTANLAKWFSNKKCISWGSSNVSGSVDGLLNWFITYIERFTIKLIIIRYTRNKF